MKAVVSKSNLADLVGLKKALGNALTGTAKAIKVDYGVTTQTWAKRPGFVITKFGPFSISVATDNEIYGYVDDGTRAHIISPKRAKVLAFGSTYRPKTSVRVIGSTGGGKGGDIVHAMVVHHPGTDAREFTETIADKWEKQSPVIMQAAINAGAGK